MKSSIDKLRAAVARVVNISEEKIFFYWKGRVALHSLLTTMGVGPGTEVILPAYTCVVVPNAILYLGAQPVYVDISKESYCPSAKDLLGKITTKTRVIICQNTYGLSTQVDEIIESGKQKGIFTIEDCTHGFGGTYKNLPNGSKCDASFFSMQWNKPFSTGVGGFAIVNNETLLEPLKKLNRLLLKPAVTDQLHLRFLYFVHRYFINDFTYWPMIRFYRWLSRHNLVVGSSSGEEISSTIMPSSYLRSFTETQAREGLKNIANLDKNINLQILNANKYTFFLGSIGKNHVPLKLFENHSFLKYPLLVRNRDIFVRRAEAEKISLGDWFSTPLHPVNENLSDWGFDSLDFPNSISISKSVVNLPTNTNDVEKVLKFLDDNKEEIIDSY